MGPDKTTVIWLELTKMTGVGCTAGKQYTAE